MGHGWIQALADLPPVVDIMLKITALLVVGWIFHLLLRRRNPRWRMLLWRGAVAGVVLLPLLGVLLPKIQLAVLGANEEVPTPPVAARPLVGYAAGFSGPDSRPGWTPMPVSGTRQVSPQTVPSSQPSSGISDWLRAHYRYVLLGTWGTVVLVLASRTARRDARLRRILKDSRPAPEWAQRLLKMVAADVECRRGVGLRRSPEAVSPLLTGMRKPVIVLPDRMASPECTEDLRGVFVHELAHLKTGDILWSQFIQTLSIALWFHPLLWRVRRAHATACEQACDARAAEYVGDVEAYSGTLARVALGLLGRHHASGGIPMARKPQIRVRLEVLSRRIWPTLRRRWVLLSALSSILVLSVLGGLKLVRVQDFPGYGFAAASERRGAQPSEPGARTVHFPPYRSLGALYVQDAGARRVIETFYHWINGTSWEYFDEAVGDVVVPAGKRLRLTVSPEGWQDLSPLSKLRPDDLYHLAFLMLPPPGPKPDDRCMPHIAHLTGLKELHIWETDITDSGMRYITNLKSLEYLVLPNISNAGLVYATQLTSLKGLYFKNNSLTNTGLAQLANLKSLEELELGGGQLGDAGLVHLANLPKLSYLLLWGKGFTEAGLVHLANIPSLKILNMQQYQVTDAGLEHLSRLEQLEVVSFSGPPVSDNGFAYLRRMRSLRILGAPLGDNALAHLKEIKSLESLDLPGEKVTDKEMAYLSEFPNLKHLKMSMPHYIDPKAYKGYYTDNGLRELTRAPLLEELFLAGPGVTDAGMAHVAKLSNLRELSLFGCPVTGQGLARLTALKSLNKVWMYVPSMTIGDLAELNGIPSLTEVSAIAIEEKKSALNISGLTQLESLRVEARKPCILGDEDLACLAKLTRLRDLALSPLELSDDGVKHLAGLTSLERLWIGGPSLTDEGLKYLKGMTKLDYLGLTGDFTDEGLRRLEVLKGLRTLNITSESAFSKEALDRLRKRLPNIQTFTVVP